MKRDTLHILAIALLLGACSRPGNRPIANVGNVGNAPSFQGGAEGYGGGDTLVESLATARRSFVRTLTLLRGGYGAANACAPTQCFAGTLGNQICETLGSLTQPQQDYCQQYLTEATNALLDLHRESAAVPFTLLSEPLFITLPTGALLNVSARTEIGPAGPVQFHSSSARGLSHWEKLALIAHESGHKVRWARLSSYPDDTTAYGPFASGRAFLNTIGAAAAKHSANHSYSGTILADGPARFWRLDTHEYTPGAPAPHFTPDASKAAVAASFHGTVVVESPGAITVPGAAARFRSDRMSHMNGDLGSDIHLNDGTRVTVELWMKWDGDVVADGDYHRLAGFANYSLIFLPGNRFGFTTNTTNLWGVSAEGLAGRWVHVVAEFRNGDARETKLYLDGKEQTLTQLEGSVGAGSNVTTGFRVGGFGSADSSGSFHNFRGAVDEIAIYDGALSAAQVEMHRKVGVEVFH